jgi:APA family basic amino acid/polyamine antiporter
MDRVELLAPNVESSRHASTLIRAIGRWSLTAAIVNGVTGASIFVMPATITSLVGASSPVAVLLAGCAIFLIVLCFAEVGSRFVDAGGPYLYTREAFGPAVGFQVGWLHVWTRLFSCAALLNVFVAYLGVLLPAAGKGPGRAIAMIAVMAVVTGLNISGIRQASWTTNVFTIAKLLPLILLIVLGVGNLRQDVLATQAVASPNWIDAVVLLVFAYGGFESAVTCASETRNPRGDTAFALIAGMLTVTVVYGLVQVSVVGVLPRAADHAAPIASALGKLLGSGGVALASVTALIAGSGWLLGFAQMTPRILYAMAERHEFPSILGRVHPRYRTPHIAILVNSCAALALGLYGSFVAAVTLAAIPRLIIFGLTCVALIVFRRRLSTPPGFVLPGGLVFATLGTGFCGWLLSTRSVAQAWILIAVVLAGFVLRVFSRGFASDRIARPADLKSP